MVRFERRFFPPRRYQLPLRWVFYVLAGGLAGLMLWIARQLPHMIAG